MFKAIIWDNDGILVQTEEWYYEANKRVLADEGIDLTFERYHDVSLRQNIGRLAPAGRGDTGGYRRAQEKKKRDLCRSSPNRRHPCLRRSGRPRIPSRPLWDGHRHQFAERPFRDHPRSEWSVAVFRLRCGLRGFYPLQAGS